MSNDINKVIVNNNIIMDISNTTATTDKVRIGEIFYQADGSETSGQDRTPTDIQPLVINKTGIYNAEENVAWNSIDVNIPFETRTGIIPTKDKQIIEPTGAYEAMNSVEIEPIPDDYLIPQGTLKESPNGSTNPITYSVKQYEKIELNLPKQKKIQPQISITPQQETIEYFPTKGNDGIAKVIVEGIGVNYIKKPVDKKILTKNNETYDVMNLAQVTVDVPQELDILYVNPTTDVQQIKASDKKLLGFHSVIVSPVKLEEKTIELTEIPTEPYTISFGDGYDGIKSITINFNIPSIEGGNTDE